MPEIGEKKRGREIGKVPTHLFVWSACKNCKTERWINESQTKDKRYLGWCRKCGNRRNGLIQGKKNKERSNGRRMTSRGYVDILLESEDQFYSMAMKSGYVKEHRYVMAKKIGRCLFPEEMVHHKDGNKTNNIPSNLELVTKYTHKIGFSYAYNKGYRDGYLEAKRQYT